MKGRERDYSKRWIEKLKAKYLNCFVYKIPDSPITRKPYDAFAFVQASEGDHRAYAIEFKMADNEVTPHQLDALKRSAQAGATALIVYFGDRGVVSRIDRVYSDGRRESFDKEGP